MNQLQSWFLSLQKRERMMVLSGAAALIIIMLYLIIWEPVFSGITNQQQRVISQRKILNWMQNAEVEARSLKASGGNVNSALMKQSISRAIETSAVSAGIRDAIAKIEARDKKSTRVQFKNVDFNRLMQWLGALESRYGISIKSANIDKADSTGVANAKITLERI